MTTISANKLELIKVAEALASEKSIPKQFVIEAMEEAIAKAAKSRYGQDTVVKVSINPNTGEQELWRELTVVEEIEDVATEIDLERVKITKQDYQVGDIIKEELPPIVFGRAAAMIAKQVIHQKVRIAERLRQYEDYKERVGEVITGIIKRIEFGHYIIDLGRAEGVIRRDQQIPTETLKQGDRIHAYIMEVKEDTQGPQIILSRSHTEFMAKLFLQEVPEIYENVVQIKSVARDPGQRAKISVYTDDPSIDPIGACVGLRGSRVQAVVNELAGEKIDIVLYSHDVATFVVNALSPAEVAKVVLDEIEKKIEIVVEEAQLSLAIGRRGQNVRLATQLTGYEIDILTDEQESVKRQDEYKVRSELFMKELDVDDMIAGLLATEGFADMEDIAFVDLQELAEIEGFDLDIAKELKTRAEEFLNKENIVLDEQRKKLGVSDDLANLEGLTLKMVVTLGENSVKNLEDFASCVVDDLLGWDEYKSGEKSHYTGYLENYNLTEEEVQILIANARQLINWDNVSEENSTDGLKTETEEEK